jgi:hypothetical protein
MTGASRADIMEAQWMNGLSAVFATKIVIDVRYLGWRPLESKSSWLLTHYVDVPPSEGDVSLHHLCTKFHVAMRLFLATRASWLLRICDDCVVNSETFDEFLRESRQTGNPNTEKIIQGHYITKGQAGYPQGGSGLILSRAAVVAILQSWASFKLDCLPGKHDDTLIGHWARNLTIPGRNITNRWFMGHSFRNVGTWWHVRRALRSVGLCRARPPATGDARSYYQRVKSVTFWHPRENFVKFAAVMKNLTGRLPDNLFFYTYWRWPVLCFGSSETRSMFYD